MESVNEWFDAGCKYHDGVQIYGNLKVKNANLLRMFKLKESPANVEKLKYELGKLRNTPLAVAKPIEAKPTVNIEATAVAIEKKQQLMFHDLPAELRPELMKANDFFKKNCYLKVTLNDLPAEAEDEALALQMEISENFKSNKICWQKIDFWLRHRVLPKVAQSGFEALTAAQLVKKQQYLYQNISKMKKRFDENLKKIESTESPQQKAQLKRIATKQNADLIKKNEELQLITKLIDGR